MQRQTRTIPVRDASLHAEAFGEPTDAPLLLIMGAAASSIWWPEGLIAELVARGLFVIRYDARDTGRSTTYPHGTTPYDLDDLADDAIAVLDGFGIRRAQIAGMSMGGITAQIVALKYPDRVSALTLISTQILGDPGAEVPDMAQDLLDFFIGGQSLDWSDRRAVIDHAVEGWRVTAGSRHPFDGELIHSLAVADWEHSPDPQAALNHQGLGGGDAWVGRTTEIAVPTLVIHGTEDRVIDVAHARALERALPDVRLLILDGAGHELHRLDWPAMVEAMADLARRRHPHPIAAER